MQGQEERQDYSFNPKRRRFYEVQVWIQNVLPDFCNETVFSSLLRDDNDNKKPAFRYPVDSDAVTTAEGLSHFVITSGLKDSDLSSFGIQQIRLWRRHLEKVLITMTSEGCIMPDGYDPASVTTRERFRIFSIRYPYYRHKSCPVDSTFSSYYPAL